MISFVMAVLPVVLLCFFVYYRDPNKEPIKLLLKIFFIGVLTAFPVIFVEGILSIFFSTDMDKVGSFILLFINVFVGVAIVEEFFKWLVVKSFGYNNRDFDEIYDIIVYSVFSSLGFACIENVFYVMSLGIGVSISRAFLSIPGHMCFGVLMGYFFAKAKLASVSNENLCKKNLALSILIPSLFHTIYDAVLFYVAGESVPMVMRLLGTGIFYLFDIAMVITCVVIIFRVSKVQNNVKINVDNGTIVKNSNGVMLNNVPTERFNFCPVCGSPANGANFCGRCGMKLTK